MGLCWRAYFPDNGFQRNGVVNGSDDVWWWVYKGRGALLLSFQGIGLVRWSTLSFSSRSQGFLFLFVLKYSVQLGTAAATDKEVDTKQVPVLGYDDQGVPGPDEACGSQYSRLGQAELICRPGHVRKPSTNKAPFEHWGPEEYRLWTCWVVVEWSQFSR